MVGVIDADIVTWLGDDDSDGISECIGNLFGDGLEKATGNGLVEGTGGRLENGTGDRIGHGLGYRIRIALGDVYFVMLYYLKIKYINF